MSSIIEHSLEGSLLFQRVPRSKFKYPLGSPEAGERNVGKFPKSTVMGHQVAHTLSSHFIKLRGCTAALTGGIRCSSK